MKIKEKVSKLIGGIKEGWERLGEEDVKQEVKVTYPADIDAHLKKLLETVDYEANLHKTSTKTPIKQSPSRYGNGRKIIPENRENSKDIDQGDRVR